MFSSAYLSDRNVKPRTKAMMPLARVVPHILFVMFVLSGYEIAFAGEADQDIAKKTATADSACRDVAELGKKYAASRKLPDSVAVEGKPCTREELSECLYSVIEKMMEKCEKEGPDAVPKEDRDAIAGLHETVKDHLGRIEAYRNRRDAIEKFISPPEEPPFLFKTGVKGFLRGEGTGNFRLPDLAYNPGHAEGRLLYRVLPYVYWHPTDFLDIHLEGQGYGYTGGSQYLGKVSLYQGFVEGRLPGTDVLSLEIGRQEFVYGSTFILGANSFFQGLTFDAAKLRVKPVDALTVDLLGGWYATPWSNGIKGNVVGGYASYTFGEGDVLEAYGFNDTGSAWHHSGEYLNIWGLRGTAKFGQVSFELEPVFESGRTFNGNTGINDRVSAWGGHADVSAEADLWGRKNRFFASFAYGSGNSESANGISARREFRNPDTDTSLTGDMSMIGDLSGMNAGGYHASGMQIFNLGWGVELTGELSFSAAGRYFRANAVPDGFSRRVGLETDFTLTYTVNEMLSFLVGYDRFFTGKFFRDTTGSSKDVDYGYVMLQFDISRQKPRMSAK
ncbi:MAG: hypothetical protein VB050_07795 [Geobacteraceae bacterium]|nr:hypothetical protein [Geobacteraceae bacterium]